MFRLSPLRVRVFQGCKLRYKYQYVDKLPARLRAQDTAGTLVHNVLADFFAKLPPEERSAERLLSMFEERWQALSPRYLRMPGVDELRKSSLEQLRRFTEEADLQAQPYLIEAYFQTWLAPDVILGGRMDRVDEQADGTLHVIDYKTGEAPEEVDAGQLRLYAIMVEEKLERPVSQASFWYLDDGSVWTIELTEEEKRQALEDALTAFREMMKESVYPPTIGKHCAYCPYLYACDYRQEIAQRRQAEGW